MPTETSPTLKMKTSHALATRNKPEALRVNTSVPVRVDSLIGVLLVSGASTLGSHGFEVKELIPFLASMLDLMDRSCTGSRSGAAIMCELLAVSATDSRGVCLDVVLAWARQMERFGIAGWGWGVAWRDGDGQTNGYRSVGALRDDIQSARLAREVAVAAIVHLRRPTRLSTHTLTDTQPFVSEDGWAFAHNGDFRRQGLARPLFAQILAGQADSEVGFHYALQLLVRGRTPANALVETHGVLRGQANMALLGPTGLWAFSRSTENTLYRFERRGLDIAATGLSSQDDSLFDIVFPDVREHSKVSGVISMGDHDPVPPRPHIKEKASRAE